VANVYFELTEAFNADGPIVALASGQAVVFYRVAIMSKDGDWVVRESAEACERVRSILHSRGGRYRPSAPLDVRWLSGGWSSHFEFLDDHRRRVRCDFVSRPPRVLKSTLVGMFDRASDGPLRVVDVESLIRMKQTQRAKDYSVIGALAALLPPQREIELTTDPDRLLALADQVGLPGTRPAISEAVACRNRRALVAALAEEIDEQRLRDRDRVDRYTSAAGPYLAECKAQGLAELRLPVAHERMVEAAERLLPPDPLGVADADAQ
jgi:hypothetical protein